METKRRRVEYRSVTSGDKDQIVALHKECFPIDYEESFYRSIMAGKLYHATVATDGDKIVGMITASNCTEGEIEDKNILRHQFWPFAPSRRLVYILTLGVTADYRREGIAKELLQGLVQHAMRSTRVQAVYLHVLATNKAAINFYENNDFTQLQFLKDYYSFHSANHDAYLYVLYINGGQPPMQWSEVIDSCKDVLMKGCLARLYTAIGCNAFFRSTLGTPALSNGRHHYLALREKDEEKII